MNGKNLILLAAGSPIAASKSCNINTNASTIEVSLPDAGAWKAFIAGRKSWNCSCNYLLSLDTFLHEHSPLTVGSTVTLSFQPLPDEHPYIFEDVYSGEVLDNVYRGFINGVYYSSRERMFVARVGSDYYKYWNDPSRDDSMFRNPVVGAFYMCKPSVPWHRGNYYLWTNGTSPLVVIPRLQGSAICTACKITATLGNLVQGSFSFQGTGPLSFVDTELE